MGENFIRGRKFYTWEKIYKSKIWYKTLGENFIRGGKIFWNENKCKKTFEENVIENLKN